DVKGAFEGFEGFGAENPNRNTLYNALKTRKPVSMAPYDRVDQVKLVVVACDNKDILTVVEAIQLAQAPFGSVRRRAVMRRKT
ncbi:MAG: hypothetical protein Q9198_011012, partial [Flavoplaca austrocitrina]